jgi:rare lipoprotein A
MARLLPSAVATLSLAALIAFALATPSAAKATTVADASRALAADTQRLADARHDLHAVKDELRTNTRRQHTLRAQVEKRLVSIYKIGGGNVMTQAAVSGNVRDASTSIDTLNLVAKHDEAAIKRWQKLYQRHGVLVARRASLRSKIAKAQKDVLRGRKRLSKAYAAAQEAREEVERMSRTKDSPLLPHVGSPEATISRAALGDEGDATSAEQPIGFTQTGVASMYADDFSGELTANGERYDPNAFTAAHPSLPLGSWVTVSGPGGSIAVRINDRGPYAAGRIIDLSRAAADAIGLAGGLGTVTLSISA